jgi:hypothetical protein
MLHGQVMSTDSHCCGTHNYSAAGGYLPGKANPRFVVTNLTAREATAKRLYERLYCARGDIEKRIKEQQLGLCVDSNGAATMQVNQLRLYFSSFAYVLLHGIAV